MRLSAIVMAKNEERNLPRCLASLSFADEILVLDTGSTDATFATARRVTPRVYRVPFAGYGPTRNAGFARAKGEWILSVDADEEVSSALAAEIQATIASSPRVAAFRLPRRAWFLSKFLRGGGWYPDHQVRLFRRGEAAYNDRSVHERIETEGSVGTLSCDLLHHSYPDLRGYLDRMNRYTDLQGRESARRTGLVALVARPVLTFVRMFLWKRGFRDGWHGYVVAVLSAGSTFFRFAKAWENSRDTGARPAPGRRGQRA